MIELRADCSRCFALCCVAPGFAKSADFAFTKAAGKPCRHLQPDFRCGTHASLRQQGFPGRRHPDPAVLGQADAQDIGVDADALH